MLKVNGVEIKQNHFPAGELFIKLPSQENAIINIEWLYENDAELFTLICIRRHYQNYECYLYLPYICHARMDRVKNEEDVFTLKYFCEVINSLNFSAVYVRDAHSNVSLALLDRVFNFGVTHYISNAVMLSGANAIFYPDEGAMKRYSDSAELPYAFGMKKRNWQTGEILGLDIINSENIVGKDVLIVDDICSRGGTFFHSAKALKEAGAKNVSLYVTHLEDTVTTGELARTDDLIDHIYTTKSIFPECLFKDPYDPYWRQWITILK